MKDDFLILLQGIHHAYHSKEAHVTVGHTYIEMSLTLKIEGNSPEETEYLKDVLCQAFPHWKFISKVEHGSSVECHFENIDSVDNGILQQKRTIKEKYPDLIIEGIKTFGTEEKFFVWLMKPAFGLFSKIPITFIDAGKKDEVLSELLRIQHGYPS